MNEFVQSLTVGNHPVAAERCKDAQELKEMIDRKYMLIKFTETRGGTELGFPLDEEKSNWQDADFENGTGSVHLEGNLELNYEKVRFVCDINLDTLKGEGHLVPLASDSESPEAA